MGWVFDAELGVKRVSDDVAAATKIQPATFRGMDCAMLAERYVAFRRSMGMDEVSDDADPIKPPAFASDPKDV